MPSLCCGFGCVCVCVCVGIINKHPLHVHRVVCLWTWIRGSVLAFPFCLPPRYMDPSSLHPSMSSTLPRYIRPHFHSSTLPLFSVLIFALHHYISPPKTTLPTPPTSPLTPARQLSSNSRTMPASRIFRTLASALANRSPTVLGTPWPAALTLSGVLSMDSILV